MEPLFFFPAKHVWWPEGSPQDHPTKSEPWAFGAIKIHVFWHVFLGPAQEIQEILKKKSFPCDIWLAGVYAHAFLGESPWVETLWLSFLQRIFQLTPENHGDYDALTTASRVVSRISRKGSTMNHDCSCHLCPSVVPHIQVIVMIPAFSLIQQSS